MRGKNTIGIDTTSRCISYHTSLRRGAWPVSWLVLWPEDSKVWFDTMDVNAVVLYNGFEEGV